MINEFISWFSMGVLHLYLASLWPGLRAAGYEFAGH